MSESASCAGPVRFVLPATSANLGPAFDSAGLAMGLTLTIDAEISPNPGGPPLTIEATGRNADRCSRTSNNMIFETYRDVLTRAGRAAASLHLRIHNEIPLGMGCPPPASPLSGPALCCLPTTPAPTPWPTFRAQAC
jgi:homoserine kinase